MKKINIVFIVLLVAVVCAAIVHTGIVYRNLLHSTGSAPAEIAFLVVGVPYALGALLLLAVWLTVRLANRQKK